jgi:hypothetical protein
LPPFFLHVLDWMPTESPFVIGITTSNRSIPQHGATAVTLQLIQTCSPGHRVITPPFAALLMQLKTNRTLAPAKCVACTAPQFG